MVVEHEDFQVGVVALEKGLQAWGDSFALVSGGNKDREGGKGREVGRNDRKTKDPQIEEIIQQQKAEGTQDEDVKKFHEQGRRL